MGGFRADCGARLINKIIWTIAIAIWAPCIYSLLGGAFVYRENLPSGLYNRYTLTIYKTLPPPGPAYCDFLTAGAYALAFSCSGKPPFVGWLQGGRY